jgi:type II restriction/modification system DNA methylase subunit YeeA
MPGIQEDRRQRLAEFTAWAAEHIKGDEKGEAQLFLDRLFQGFGQKGIMEAGATLEMRVKKADNGGTAFADLVWKPIVLIEMKKRGADLSRHYRQAFDYWTRLVPNRPRYVILCNFDEFWVYDFETQMDSPLDQVRLVELPDRWGPLAFLFPNNIQPTFGNDQEAVTRKAADLLAQCFNKLVARGVDRGRAQRFTLQMLVALFAEDIGLLDKYFVTNLLDECKEPSDSYDLLGGLFAAMNSRERPTGGRFKSVDYFNGGLFAEPARVELYPDELSQLRQAAKSDWSKVRPEIFGTLFEHSLLKKARHAFGAYFTSPVDIMKIVGPTIVEPWREQIENARTLARLRELVGRLHSYRVLDPACGSGNFLYIAYRELRRLEARLFERIAELSKETSAAQGVFGFVSTAQFFGLDIDDFAIELAKVTMMIARKLAIDELHTIEPALPLDNLDKNFCAGDALLDAQGNPAKWPKADVIIGNPPFLGAKRLKPERGADYVNSVRRAYPEIPGMADYCVYWLRKAHDALSECTADDALAGRAGLVGTQNVRNNQSRVGGLDYIVKTGTIVEAVDNQPWSGEANVHVSITNWVKTQEPSLLPEKRRLWFKIETIRTNKRRKSGTGSATKEYELDVREADQINSALSDKTDVSGARRLSCNTEPQRVFQGQVPGHDAFVLSKSEAKEMALPFLSVIPGEFGLNRAG